MSNGLHIRLADAGKRYNRDWIFRRLAADIPAGSRLALVGSNGSGKSTLLQCLAGYQALSSGSRTYELAGQPLAEGELFRHLSMAAPYLDLPEAYTLSELLDFHFSLKKLRSDFDLQHWVTEAGLTAHRNKQLLHYSSGMKQRVKLLLAIGSEVPLLLLDEPTTNLDAQGVDWYAALIDQGAAQQTIIVASNQPHEYAFCEKSLRISDYKL
jgi:ABC-type multidrug transport system ATPase subunit